jgi:DNA-binding SARP family transcriptional activator
VSNPLGEARAELALARVSEPEAGRELAARSARRLRELGARGHAHAAAALLAELDRSTGAPLEIQTLGRFAVLREGEPVGPAEWQSKKARDLLKILVARRGSPAPRDALMEALWPEQDPSPLSNRLSVALATLRAVLDPQHRFDRDHFVAGDRSAVLLRVDRIAVDVERFLADAGAGLAGAPERLEAAEAAYAGDFLQEDAYEDWATPLRELARVTYADVLRALAARATDRGESTRYLLRLLERDPYDERAHLDLVAALSAAGRHGEARRFYGAYSARMEQIGVEPAPFPARGPSLSAP